MTNAQIVRLILEFLAIALGVYCIYREADIAKWERKMWSRLKVFLRSVRCTIQEKKAVNHPSAEIIEFPIKK